MAAGSNITQVIPNYRIGSPDYDADMDIIEMFVQSKQNPEDVTIQQRVQSYYIYSVSTYWDEIRKYVITGSALKEYQYHEHKTDTPGYTVEALHKHQNYIFKRIDEIQRQFERTSRVDLISIGDLFGYMANISCLDTFAYSEPCDHKFSNWESNELRLTGGIVFPLPNGTGLFGLNTYLYAFFEQIHLVGIPIRFANFDGSTHCACDFVEHDFGHVETIEIIIATSRDAINQMKSFYDEMVTNSGYTIVQKECNVAVMWLRLHENKAESLEGYEYYNIHHPRIFLENFGYQFNELASAGTIEEFRTEFLKFRAFTFSPENITSLLLAMDRENSVLGQMPEEEDDFITAPLSLRDHVDDIDAYLLTLDSTSRISPDYFIFLLAFWFHLRCVEFNRILL